MSAEHFLGLGMPAEDAESRARAGGARRPRASTRLVGAPPRWRWFVPGRIEVFGKHTDYAGGRSLWRRCRAASPWPPARATTACVRVMDVRYGARTDDRPGATTAGALNGWASYVQVVARRFARNFPGAELGVDLAIASDLPRAAGLSSSSALVVGCRHRAGAPRAALRRAPSGGPRSAASKTWPGISAASRTASTTAASRARPASARTAAAKITPPSWRAAPGTSASTASCRWRTRATCRCRRHWTFVIASSGVHADKAGSVRDDYNRASLATRALLHCWNEARRRTGPLAGRGAGRRRCAAAAVRPDCLADAGWLHARRRSPRGCRTSSPRTAACRTAARAFAAADARALGELCSRFAARGRRMARQPDARDARRSPPRPSTPARWRPAALARASAAASGRWCRRTTRRRSPRPGWPTTRAAARSVNGCRVVRRAARAAAHRSAGDLAAKAPTADASIIA